MKSLTISPLIILSQSVAWCLGQCTLWKYDEGWKYDDYSSKPAPQYTSIWVGPGFLILCSAACLRAPPSRSTKMKKNRTERHLQASKRFGRKVDFSPSVWLEPQWSDLPGLTSGGERDLVMWNSHIGADNIGSTHSNQKTKAQTLNWTKRLIATKSSDASKHNDEKS